MAPLRQAPILMGMAGAMWFLIGVPVIMCSCPTLPGVTAAFEGINSGRVDAIRPLLPWPFAILVSRSGSCNLERRVVIV